MNHRWLLYGRGCAYAFLQSCGVAMVAAQSLPGTLVMGSVIAYVWSGNVQAQAGLQRGDRLVYAFGGGSGMALGTIVGTVIGRWVR